MIFESVRIGIIAALIVIAPQAIQAQFPSVNWASPLFLLGIGALAIFLYGRERLKKSEELTGSGLSDLLLYVHSPLSQDSHLKWLVRAVISFLLVLCGGRAGAEGASVEFLHGVHLKWRSSATRWFEQRRRSQVGSVLAASLASAFSAPFAGLMFSVELGVGGRTVSIFLSSILSFLTTRILQSVFHLPILDLRTSFGEVHLLSGKEWVGVFILASVGGLLGVFLLGFIRYAQGGFQSLFRGRIGWRVFAASVLLCSVLWVSRVSFPSSGVLLDHLVWAKPQASELFVLGLAQVLSLSLLVSGFGTIGWLWPLFTLGSLFGVVLHSVFLHPFVVFSLPSVLLGAVVLWSAVLNTPLTCALIVFEMTHNVYILIPALVAGGMASWIAQRVCRSLFFEKLFHSQPFSLRGGRSSRVLESISVKDAMVTDFEVILDNESISELRVRMFRSPYPFFPVVNHEGTYQGMLTLDTLLEIEEGAFLGSFLEAKDLLYRQGLTVPVVQSSDLLASTVGFFESVPCVAVVDESHKLMGLLFVYHVRLAYDREVTRRSLNFVPKE